MFDNKQFEHEQFETEHLKSLSVWKRQVLKNVVYSKEMLNGKLNKDENDMNKDVTGKDGNVKEKGRKIGPEIHCTDLKLSRNLSAHVRKSGVDEVTMMHGWIIRYLYENRERDIFQKDIEQKFSVGRSTVTNLLQLMEKKGFVRRESVKQDARLKKVILTEKGIASQESFEDIVEHIEEELSEGISEEELYIFYKVLDRIKQNVEKNKIW